MAGILFGCCAVFFTEQFRLYFVALFIMVKDETAQDKKTE